MDPTERVIPNGHMPCAPIVRDGNRPSAAIRKRVKDLRDLAYPIGAFGIMIRPREMEEIQPYSGDRR